MAYERELEAKPDMDNLLVKELEAAVSHGSRTPGMVELLERAIAEIRRLDTLSKLGKS